MAYAQPVEKATFRLPEWQLARLRARSRREHRSLNAVVAGVIAAGLAAGEQGDERASLVRALGTFLVTPAGRGLPPLTHEPSPVSLTDALDWTRGER